MKHRTSVRLENSSAIGLRIILEPYANEFMLPPGGTCEVVGYSEELIPEISIEYIRDAIVFWGQSAGAVYEYSQDSKLVD